jgi:hypothetical protein
MIAIKRKNGPELYVMKSGLMCINEFLMSCEDRMISEARLTGVTMFSNI